MTTYVYTRVASSKRATEAQLTALRKRFPGCVEVVETSARERPKLDALIMDLRLGDVVVVPRLSVLGRSVAGATSKMKAVIKAGATVCSADGRREYGAQACVVLKGILAEVADHNWQTVRERAVRDLDRSLKTTKAGKGRRYTDDDQHQAVELCTQGHSMRAIAERLGIPGAVIRRWCKRTGHLTLVGS